jgi:uncharacterized protein (TIGR02145 family)
MLLIMISGCGKEEDPVAGGSVTDIEGNTYRYVVIGSQTWMAENLKTGTFNDGSEIRLVTRDNFWSSTTAPAYCWYNNDHETYGEMYGAMYNWYAVETGKLCPVGWHVPKDREWTQLTDYLGGENEAVDKLKEAGSLHWISLNSTATNSSGFTALPNGIRFPFEYTFSDIGFAANWWSSDEVIQDKRFAWYRELWTEIRRDGSLKIFGIGVRCIKD